MTFLFCVHFRLEVTCPICPMEMLSLYWIFNTKYIFLYCCIIFCFDIAFNSSTTFFLHSSWCKPPFYTRHHDKYFVLPFFILLFAQDSSEPPSSGSLHPVWVYHREGEKKISFSSWCNLSVCVLLEYPQVIIHASYLQQTHWLLEKTDNVWTEMGWGWLFEENKTQTQVWGGKI